MLWPPGINAEKLSRGRFHLAATKGIVREGESKARNLGLTRHPNCAVSNRLAGCVAAAAMFHHLVWQLVSSIYGSGLQRNFPRSQHVRSHQPNVSHGLAGQLRPNALHNAEVNGDVEVVD